jgi:excinuclease ABC subunit C
MAQTNAKFLLDELKIQRMKRSDMIPHPVQSLQRDLRLKNPPRRLECFDNSNIHGTDPVSSMVCFVDGKPRRSEYRKYKIRTVVGPDDFASMKEVVGRRYARVLKEGWAFPDLIVIDGGKGQVSAAMEALRELGLEHLPLIGLAKRLEEIVLPGERETLLLPKASSSLRLLQQIRDEAHRFAITFHRTLRGKRMLQTELTNIPGVGPKTVQKIHDKFGSVRGVQQATLEQLQEELGPRTGEAVYEYFQSTKAASDEASTESPAGALELPVIQPNADVAADDDDEVQLLEDDDDDDDSEDDGDLEEGEEEDRIL